MTLKDCIKNVRNTFDELDSVATELFAERARQHGKAFEKAIDDGWFIPFLKYAEATGLGLAGAGYMTDNRFLTGFGLGLTGMAGVYHFFVNKALKSREYQRNQGKE